eukprot:3581914-Rhodomonas_salina.1
MPALLTIKLTIVGQDQVYGGEGGYAWSVDINPAIFNQIFTLAWEKFCLTATQAVLDAYVKTGLWQFNPSECNSL